LEYALKNKIAILAERFFALLIFSALFLAPPAAFAGLTEFFTATGKLFLSADGAGSNSASHIAQIEKPNASATVRQAFVLAASTGFSSRVLNNGDVSINSTPINWDAQVPGAIFNSNHRADVTSIVKPIVDAAPPGRVTFTFTEVSTPGIDGEVLVVVFDDPLQTADSTISLLFGAQNISGDTFSITLAEPIDPSAPGAVADMALGISFGCQPGGQRSIVNINDRRLSSSAGGQDESGVCSNGQLITVGGLDDSNANPDPDTFPTSFRTDDELYSLILGNAVNSQPFITASDTSISVFTQNPSNDDNIFFAYFHLSGAAIVGEGIVLSPTGVSNPVGTQHTVTARVSNDNGVPVQGALVTFNVISGPNTGDNGTDTTDVNGEATFTYTGDGGAGTDQIQASFVDSQENTKTSNTVTKEWTPTEANTPPVADPQSVTTAEDTPKNITLTGSDADNDSLTCNIVTPPEHGAVSECPAAIRSQLSRARRQARLRLQKERRIPGTMASTLSPSARSAVAASTSAFTVTYTPAPNYNGPDSFTFKVNDGKADSAPATVNITVTPEPDPPEIQNLRFARRIYSTPGIAALLDFRDVDGDSPITLRAALTARNVPKGCGSDVLPSDPASINFSEVVNGPDGDPFSFEQAEVKALEIGPQAMEVAAEHGCQVTLELTNFSVQGVDPTGRKSNVLTGSFSIDSDNGAAAMVATAASSQLRSRSAARKIAPPVVR
jgi:hypothetical protein